MRRTATLSLALCTAASTVLAADLPQYVKGPVSGLIHDCEQAKQKAPKPDGYVDAGDLDGDGRPDHVVAIARGCQANRDLYCNDEGCLIELYVSSRSGRMGSLKVKSFGFGRHGAQPALLITRAGEACAGQAGGVCSETLVFDGNAFAKAP